MKVTKIEAKYYRPLLPNINPLYSNTSLKLAASYLFLGPTKTQVFKDNQIEMNILILYIQASSEKDSFGERKK